MKSVFLFCSLLSLCNVVYAQQDSSGVYLTLSDFQQQKLAYAIICRTQKHKIKQTSFSDQKFIKVVHNDSVITLSKSEVFGYRDCKGLFHRFIDKVNYAILNPTEYIILYKHEVRAHKQSELHYMFSRGLDGHVYKLTKQNLKQAFSDQFEFQKKIDEVFKNDIELSRYDKATKTYLINWLYGRVKT
ncbi:MAG: hypothetical protein L6Q51_05665 [Cyclobacteriaceae bacterium]|jgi:hypothetical protein|nr:hypothetical protein [Cyclobacteriaceae bacterium]